METALKITRNWNELKTELKQKYPNLTEADLTYSAGKEEELITNLSKKIGKTPDEVSNMIEDLQSKTMETPKSETGSKQPENKQPESKMPESKQPESKMPENKQPESKLPEDKQPEGEKEGSKNWLNFED
ncbi:MAG: hypothetical protein A3F72_17495 [Bacteroidetes bacterium RIFCSPLOWO2_12_FULL_35_15]|nr:MAG: hypothetical protein A3F72_17495 [Bacteroidetes bacterium RIFCSPLOWO2_12_FULL_35_15]